MKTIRYLELFWLIFAILLLGVAVFITYQESFSQNWIYWIFPVVALVMFFIRRKQRKKQETRN